MFADLSGKVALVTGGGQGLGLGIVLKMAEQGADIAIADLSEENAAGAARQVEALGRKAYTARMDVTDKDSGQRRRHRRSGFDRNNVPRYRLGVHLEGKCEGPCRCYRGRPAADA